MKYTLKFAIIPTILLLTSCGLNKGPSRATAAHLPVSNNIEQVVYQNNPILEIKNFGNSKFILNTETIFSMNDSMKRNVTFRAKSSKVLSALLQRIHQYPEDSKIHIQVYRFGNYDRAYLQQLSSNQAATMAALLWDYGNIAHNRITFEGMGNSGKTVTSATDVNALIQNNRIEITLS